MSIIGKQKDIFGSGLLSLAAWMHRQRWLISIYRHLPNRVRRHASNALLVRRRELLRFKRTPNWRRQALPPSPASVNTESFADYSTAIGLNIFAYTRGQFGLAESARLYAHALLAEGYPVSIHEIAIDIPHAMEDRSLEPYLNAPIDGGVNMVFVNPDHLDQALRSIGCERLGDRYTIACWFWELEKFPSDWVPAMKLVDEIMVSTSFIEATIKRATEKPVWRAPLPVGAAHDSGLTRTDFGINEESFVFLNTFDFNSSVARKNPMAAIKAFQLAFAADRRDVRLLIKSSNGYRHPEKLQQLLNAAGTDQRITVRDEVIDRSDVNALQRCVDAYISMHRAEGFGLGIAECMQLGKPVIATAWSGNMDFMTAENSCLVDYELVSVGKGDYVHYNGQRWAEPSIEHAASQMRRIVGDPEFATRIGEQAMRDIREKLSPHASAQRIIQRLETLSSSDALVVVGSA